VPPNSLTDLAGLRVSTEDFLAAVLETAAQPIWVVDRDGVLRFANPAAITALGYDSADELLGRHSHDTIHYKHPDGTPYPAVECPMLLPRTTGETATSDLDWFFRRDGSMFPVSYVSVPLDMPEGRGAVVAFTDIEDRLRAEQALREREAMFAAREDSLRRIAALVAGGAASTDVFAAIAREVGHVLGLPVVLVWRYDDAGQTTATVIGAWGEDRHPFQAGTRWPLDGPTLLAQVLKTGRPARIDDYTELPGTTAEAVRKTGLRAVAGAPIIVDGDIWGAMLAGTAPGAPLPDQIEDRLANFTELVATAISNTESRAGLARLAEEQAALRRVATLAARGTSPKELFAAVVEEAGRVLPVMNVAMARYQPDRTMTVLAISKSLADSFPVGSRWPLGGKNVSTVVFETARSARVDDYADAPGRLSAAIRERALSSAVGAPIVVEGRVWGVMTLASTEQPLPVDTETRLDSFTELVATAIANAESRAAPARLAEEQAALRRVATLVARGTPAAEVFSAVAEEMERLFAAQATTIGRLEPGGTVSVVASCGSGRMPLGARLTVQSGSVLTKVVGTGRAARVDDYTHAKGVLREVTRRTGIRCSVAVPIMVEGSLWGSIAVGTVREQFPTDTEQRMAEFTELVGTAISNIQAREDLAASRARIVAAADDERRRVVRDLHDGAQQRIVHTVITLKLARRALQNDEKDLPDLLTEALDHAEQTTDELRELAHGILPAVLTQGGLRAGVDALASRMAVPVENAVSVGRLPAVLEATAYFVVAEALTNVAKHAHARHAGVAAQIDDGRLAVQVRDDGVGGAQPGGSGLVGLADRVAALDGQLRVESPVDGGTLVIADIPVPD
jgi:PAS domain S-box-containing protein